MVGVVDTAGRLPRQEASADCRTKSMADKIPSANFVLVEGSGHMTPIENPQEVNKAIKDFLIKNNF